MIGPSIALLLSVVTGVSLEAGVQLVSGRREAWDSEEFWTTGLPIALVIAFVIGLASRERAWLTTLAIASGQVLAMMARSGEIGSLWPLTLVLSMVLSTPFVAAAFVGSRVRRSRRR